MILHSSSNLGETSNVATSHERRKHTLLRGGKLQSGLQTILEDRLHDSLELIVDLLRGPGEPGRVLGHLETRNSDTAGVSCLAGCVPDGGGTGVSLTVGLEDIDSGLGAAHVGTLGDELGTGVDESLGFLAGNFVLGCGGEGDVDLSDVHPGTGAGDVLELACEGGGGGDAGDLLAVNLDLGDEGDFLGGEAAFAVDDQGTLAV